MKDPLSYIRVYESLEKDVELVRRLKEELPTTGGKSHAPMSGWRPGMASPYRGGDKIVWKKVAPHD